MLRIISVVIVTVGLSFTSCNKDTVRTSLLGSWNCEELPEFSPQTIYQVNIVRNNLLPNDTNQYVIYNFNQLGLEEERAVYFIQEPTGELVITGTEIVGIYIEGSGIVTSDFSKISWHYKVNKGGPNENIIATYY